MWRRAAAAVLVVMSMAACQSQTAAVNTTPSGGTALSPGATASPVASPSPATSPLPPVASTLACRLPISDGTPGGGGFITFPGGQFAVDPASNVTVPRDGAGGRTVFGLTYDLGFKKWLPVPYDWVTPDGTKYVYPTNNTILVVDVRSGAVVNELTKQPGGHWWPEDAENNAVWASQVYDATISPPVVGGYGLQFFPFTGGFQGAPANDYRMFTTLAMRGSIAYSADGNDRYSPIKGRLFRADLSNGTGVKLFGGDPGPNSTANPFTWVGVANDNALVLLVDGSIDDFVGTSTTPLSIDLGGDTPLIGFLKVPVAGDAHGLWIAGQNGLYLVTSSGVFRASDHTGVLAGGCG